LITLGIAALLCWEGGLTGEEFAGLVKIALTVFVAGNGVEHVMSAKKEGQDD
jgi:hypothetical protein